MKNLCFLIVIYLVFYGEWSFGNGWLDGSGQVPTAVEEAESAVFVISHGSNTKTGGSGFFFGDTNTFVTAVHVITAFFSQGALSFEDSVENLVLLKDGNIQKEIQFTGIKYVSLLSDQVVFSVKGYTGPFLKPESREVAQASAFETEDSFKKVNKSKVYLLGYPLEEQGYFALVEANYITNDYLKHSHVLNMVTHVGPVASLNGMSGGPVLNSRGEVMGSLMGGDIATLDKKDMTDEQPCSYSLCKMAILSFLARLNVTFAQLSIADILHQIFHTHTDLIHPSFIYASPINPLIQLEPGQYSPFLGKEIAEKKASLLDEKNIHYMLKVIYETLSQFKMTNTSENFDVAKLVLKMAIDDIEKRPDLLDGDAKYIMGRAYGVIEENQKSVYWLRQAANEGHPLAQVHLYKLLFSQDEKSPEGIKWLEEASTWFSGAQFSFGVKQLFGDTHIPKDEYQARKKIEEAHDQNDILATLVLYHVYLEEDIPSHRAKALELLPILEQTALRVLDNNKKTSFLNSREEHRQEDASFCQRIFGSLSGFVKR